MLGHATPFHPTPCAFPPHATPRATPRRAPPNPNGVAPPASVWRGRRPPTTAGTRRRRLRLDLRRRQPFRWQGGASGCLWLWRQGAPLPRAPEGSSEQGRGDPGELQQVEHHGEHTGPRLGGSRRHSWMYNHTRLLPSSDNSSEAALAAFYANTHIHAQLAAWFQPQGRQAAREQYYT